MPRTSENDLKHLLDDGAGDKVLIDAFDQLLTSEMRERSAAQTISAAGLIAAARPQLTHHCLRKAVASCHRLGATMPLYVTTFGEAVSRYNDFSSIAGPAGTRWLREELPRLSDVIEKMLRECREAHPNPS